MNEAIQRYWQIRLNNTTKALEKNNFEVYPADNTSHAKKIVMEEILPKLDVKSVSWGGSMTFLSTGLYEAVKALRDLNILDAFDKTLPREQSLELRRQALLVDLYITGTNAVTESGQLVNLDMYGNRVAAINFGPKNVLLLVGRNKIVPEIEDAMLRIKNYAAPVNATRLDKKTPCVTTSRCEECYSPDRICNIWTITEKSFPTGRIRIILINEDLGF